MYRLFILSVVITYISVFLKGFQHKNVIGGHLKCVVVTSYLMGLFDVVAVTLIVKGGLWISISAGTGAALGMVSSILVHDKLFGCK